MSSSTTDRITVACACGARLKVPAAAAGKRARCPKCGEPFTVPAPEPPPAPPADLAGSAADDLSVLEQASAAPGAAVAAPCPGCGAALPLGAVLCTACGYNLKTGRKLKGAKVGSAAGSAAVGAAAKAAKAAGNFVLGCVLSGVAALIGAGVWYGIAMSTGYEIGWVAWGIGGITGLGMAVGSRSAGPLQGGVASMIAFGSIILAKLFIVWAVFGQLSMILERGAVAASMTEEILVQRGTDSNEASPEQYLEATDEADRRVEALSDAEVRARFAELEIPQGEGEDMHEELQKAREEVEAGFFKYMFGPLDILFIVLAIATAFKVAENGVGFGSG